MIAPGLGAKIRTVLGVSLLIVLSARLDLPAYSVLDPRGDHRFGLGYLDQRAALEPVPRCDRGAN